MKKAKKEIKKKLFKLYDNLVFTQLVKNNSKYCRTDECSNNEIGIDFLGTYQNDRITFYYIIEKYPHELVKNFKSRIRKECRGETKVAFLNYLREHSIEWNSPQMQNRLKILKEVGDSASNKNVDAYNLYSNIGTIAKQKWVEDSLVYLSEADIKRNCQLLKTSMLMVVSGVRGEHFDDSVECFEKTCANLGLGINRVLYNIPDVISMFSPFKHSQVEKNESMGIPTHVITDEIVSRFNTCTQGTLGVDGLYFGTDVYSKFPILKVVKPKVDTAENWLITAETGGGKSYLVKALALQLLASDFYATIMDIEGFEYTPLAYFLGKSSKVQIINMAEGSGKYFDPVEIALIDGMDKETADSAKTMSINFTLAIFKVLLGKAYTENTWLDIIINDAVAKMYESCGVTNDIKTWGNSKGKTLFDVYKYMKALKNTKDDDNYRSAVEEAVAICGRYFEPKGNRSNVFSERVMVSDIVEAELVICSFGMAGKSPQSVDDIQLALMQLSASQLSHQRSIFSKSQGKFNFKIWEEFQRWGNFPDSDKTIGVAVTGGRKLGDVNIIVTNNIKDLLDNDRFAIFGNLTSILCGAVSDKKVREDLCDRLSINNLLPELNMISEANKSVESIKGSKVVDSALSYSFLCKLDRSKVGICKMTLPSGLRNSKIFKTGVDIKKEKVK